MNKLEKSNRKGSYIYRGVRIDKRRGMDMKRRAVRGWSAYALDLNIRHNFRTLQDAVAYIDEKIG